VRQRFHCAGGGCVFFPYVVLRSLIDISFHTYSYSRRVSGAIVYDVEPYLLNSWSQNNVTITGRFGMNAAEISVALIKKDMNQEFNETCVALYFDLPSTVCLSVFVVACAVVDVRVCAGVLCAERILPLCALCPCYRRCRQLQPDQPLGKRFVHKSMQ
jgi:hypothetical protein